MSTGASEAKRSSKSSRENAEEAIDQAFYQRDTLVPGSANFGGLQQIAELFRTDPIALTPEVVQGLKVNAANDANDAFRNALDQSRQGLSLGPGVRSGAARQNELNLAAALGNDIANSNRELDVAARTQRLQDLIQAFNLQQAALGEELQPQKELINTQLGGSSAIGAAAANSRVSNPAGGIGNLIGTLGGAYIGKPK